MKRLLIMVLSVAIPTVVGASSQMILWPASTSQRNSPSLNLSAIHIGTGHCDNLMRGADKDGNRISSGWMNLNSDNLDAVFVIGADDRRPVSSCPKGYQVQGQIHTSPGEIDGDREGYDYSGHWVDSGWMTLCSLDDAARFVISTDDCGNPTYACPSGYTVQGYIHTGPGKCDGNREGYQYDGNTTDSGWMALCAKPGKAWLTIGAVDCKGGSTTTITTCSGKKPENTATYFDFGLRNNLSCGEKIITFYANSRNEAMQCAYSAYPFWAVVTEQPIILKEYSYSKTSLEMGCVIQFVPAFSESDAKTCSHNQCLNCTIQLGGSCP